MPAVRGSTLTRPGSSIIVQPVGSQTKPTVYSRAQEIFRKLPLSLQDVGTPERLLDILQRLQSNVWQAIRPLSQNPIAMSVNILQGCTFTTGQTRYLNHSLGHAYMGWWCVRSQGLAASLVEAALPASVTAAQVLPLTSANAGTYDIAVF